MKPGRPEQVVINRTLGRGCGLGFAHLHGWEVSGPRSLWKRVTPQRRVEQQTFSAGALTVQFHRSNSSQVLVSRRRLPGRRACLCSRLSESGRLARREFYVSWAGTASLAVAHPIHILRDEGSETFWRSNFTVPNSVESLLRGHTLTPYTGPHAISPASLSWFLF